MWIPLIVVGTCLIEASGLSVYPMKNEGKCQVQITHSMVFFVLNEEPAIIKCPVLQYIQLDLSKVNNQPFHLEWTRNGSEHIYAEKESRIHANQEALWFMPALIKDSGTYTCVLRNASSCIEISLSFNVVRDTAESVPDLKFQQIAFEHSDFNMNCPDLTDFTKEPMTMRLKWYKEGELLKNSSKFIYSESDTLALINDVRHNDEGFYRCQMAFTYQNVDFTISRIIHLQTVGQEKKQHPVIVNPSRKAIKAAIGSKLVIPCKVFTGHDDNNLNVWWIANDSFVDEVFEDGRVTEGMPQTTEDTDGHYIEVLLIFEWIEEVDFSTDFKCIASNDYGQQVLPTQIKRAASSFVWYIAAVPVFVVFIIIASIFINKCRKSGNKKDYSLVKL